MFSFSHPESLLEATEWAVALLQEQLLMLPGTPLSASFESQPTTR